MFKRVVITGMGAVTPLGHNVAETWDELKKGSNGIDTITSFDCSTVPVRIGGEIKGLKFDGLLDRRERRKMARFTQLFMASSIEAVRDAKLEGQDFYPEDEIAVVLGNGIGGFEVMEEAARQLVLKGYPGVPPLAIPKLISNEGAANAAIHFGYHGPCYSVVTACASGTDAIGSAFLAIRHGQIAAALVGGAESTMTQLAISCFAKLTALAVGYNDNPQAASRPFDKERSGFVIGEGSGSLILEELEAAKKRGATIYGEILGYGMTCDAHHLTAPETHGTQAANAMVKAVKMAGLQANQIGYINAHGTSTPLNDRTETEAIKTAFADHAYQLKVSSLKSMTGHMIGGAGAVELIATVCSLRDQFVHPTINYEYPDEDCDLDYIPNHGQPYNFDYAISNSLGFGGHNGSLLVGRYKGD